jgi:hypothetical protein
MRDDATRFPFDYWVGLARVDPDGFETERRALLERLIESAPSVRRLRLRGLQWQVDQLRRLAGSPLGACMRISGLMWDRVLGDGGLGTQLQSVEGAGATAANRLPVNVVGLHRRR